MPHIAIFSALGVPNYGDELIGCTARKFYEKEVSDATFTCWTVNQEYSQAQAVAAENDRVAFSDAPIRFVNFELAASGVRAESGRAAIVEAIREARARGSEQEAVIRAIVSKSDLLHFAGGGYINSAYSNVILMLAVLAIIAEQCGKPFIFSGITLHRFPEELRELMTWLMTAAAAVDVRDDTSQEFLEQISAGATLSCDDVFYLSDYVAGSHLDRPYDRMAGPASLNFLLTWDLISRADTAQLRENIREGLVNEARKGVVIRPCAFFALPDRSDLDAVEAVGLPGDTLGPSMSFVFREPMGAIGTFAQAIGSIGTRFHFALLSFLLLRPAMTPLYSDRDRRMLFLHDRIGSRSLLPIPDIDAASVARFTEVCASGEDRERLADRRDVLFREKRDILRNAVRSAGLRVL